jgi:hypothetical protein
MPSDASSRARAALTTACALAGSSYILWRLAKAYVYAKESERIRHRQPQEDGVVADGAGVDVDAFEREQVRIKMELAALAAQGNLGTSTTSQTAGLVSLTPEQCGGRNERYSWVQDEREIVVEFASTSGNTATMTSKDVRVDVRTKSIRVEIQGIVMLEGELTRRVLVDECLWELEDYVERDGRRRKRVKVTLVKLRRTFAKFHWPAVCFGEPEIEKGVLESFGDPVIGVNGSDSGDMARMMEEISALKSASPRKEYVRVSEGERRVM